MVRTSLGLILEYSQPFWGWVKGLDAAAKVVQASALCGEDKVRHESYDCEDLKWQHSHKTVSVGHYRTDQGRRGGRCSEIWIAGLILTKTWNGIPDDHVQGPTAWKGLVEAVVFQPRQRGVVRWKTPERRYEAVKVILKATNWRDEVFGDRNSPGQAFLDAEQC